MRRLLLLSAASILAAVACEGSQGADGPPGPAGSNCAVTDNGDGTKTVSCPGSSPVTIANGDPGAAGTSCSVTDNGNGTKTITCTDNTSVTVSDGTPCAAVDNGDGTKTITCPGSAPITVSDGTNCTLVDNGDGTSVLSCDDGTRTIIAPPLDTHLDAWEDLPGVKLTVLALGGDSNPDGSFASGDHVAVTYSLTTTSGRVIPIHEIDVAGAWIAGPNSNYQHILPAARDAVMLTDVAANSQLNDDGTYTYTFVDAIPANFGVPLFDTTKFTDGELTGPLTAGTYTVALSMSKDYWIEGRLTPDANSTVYDFGLDTPTLANHEYVTVGNCNTCHQRFQMHEGMYRSPELCVTCHTSGAEDMGSTDSSDATNVSIDFRVMVHRIHNSFHLPSVQGVTTDASGNRVYGTGTPYVVGTADFSAILYPAFPNFNIAMPKDTGYSLLSTTAVAPETVSARTKNDNVRKGVSSCGDCHGDPDGAGPLAAPSQGADVYDLNNAVAMGAKRACASCHDDLDYAKPYVNNGQTMGANKTEAQCSLCHDTAQVTDAHVHPTQNTVTSPPVNIAVTSLTGGSGPGGKFLIGDSPSVTFTVKDPQNADVPISYLDSFSLGVTGPTQNRQVVIPGALTATPFDITGRLLSASTTNKGIMSKVTPTGTPVTETLTVEFSSATAFSVTGTASGALGIGALPASPGTYPSGASLSNVLLSPTAVAQNVTIAFTSPTAYTVTGTVSGAMGGGTLPNSVSTQQRFTSTDSTLSFNIVVGTTAPAAGNSFFMSVVKGSAANPVLFAVVGGRTAFAATDRFYFDFVAPAASYTLKVPMDLQLEWIGTGSAVVGQTFTAGNGSPWYGRQSLFEGTGVTGTATTLTTVPLLLGKYVTIATIDAGLASNDYVVIDRGLATEEYARVSAIDVANKRITLANPLRYAHAIGASFQEETVVYRQEGALAGIYTLNPATGVMTLIGSAPATSVFLLTYRTNATFGWKRKPGDALQSWYYANLNDNPALDETWGDWRGKPLVDGTYTIGIWGYHSIELQSGSAGAYEWQTYRDTMLPGIQDFLFGPTATALQPYSKIDTGANCNNCHNDLSFHGGGRRSADTCLMCHATPGATVNYRTLLHGAHADTFPVFPNGAAECTKCHGANLPFAPTNRNHPTAQVKPAQDWNIACTGCHTSAAAGAHADSMVSSATGVESCETCHGADRDLAVEQVHKAR